MRKPYYTLETLEANNSVGYLLKRCGVLMTAVAEERFESLEISFTQWIVLTHLAQQAHISATQLSAHIGHDMGALTRVVDELDGMFAFALWNRKTRPAQTASNRWEVLPHYFPVSISKLKS